MSAQQKPLADCSRMFYPTSCNVNWTQSSFPECLGRMDMIPSNFERYRPERVRHVSMHSTVYSFLCRGLLPDWVTVSVTLWAFGRGCVHHNSEFCNAAFFGIICCGAIGVSFHGLKSVWLSGNIGVPCGRLPYSLPTSRFAVDFLRRCCTGRVSPPRDHAPLDC